MEAIPTLPTQGVWAGFGRILQCSDPAGPLWGGAGKGVACQDEGTGWDGGDPCAMSPLPTG